MSNAVEDSYNRDYYQRRRSLGRSARNQGILRMLRRHHRSDRLLEVGFGLGDFLCAAKADFRCVGYEVSAFAVTYVRERLGTSVPIVLGDGTTLPFEAESFDVVVALDVLEHVPNPVELAREMQRCLAVGGRMVMTVPNVESLGHRIKKDNWFAYRDPTHINLWPWSHWRVVLEEAGFEIEMAGSDCLWDAPYVTKGPLGNVERVLGAFYSIPKRWLLPMSMGWNGENLVVSCRKLDTMGQTGST